VNPDTHFWHVVSLVGSIAGNALAFFIWRYKAKADEARRLKREATRDYKFRAMWKEYAEFHNMPVNGDD